MHKPSYLRKDTYSFILAEAKIYATKGTLANQLKRLSYPVQPKDDGKRLTKLILDKPAAFLLHIGIFNSPQLLKDTVISLIDGLDFVIDSTAAKQLSNSEQIIKLKTLYKPKEFEFTLEEIKKAFKNHCEFDQFNSPSSEKST